MDSSTIRSRRAILTGAAASAAALAANAALPASKALAVANNPLLLDVTSNASTAATVLTSTLAGNVLTIVDADPASVGLNVQGGAVGLSAKTSAATSQGILSIAPVTGAAIVGIVGSAANAPLPSDRIYSGVIGYSDPGDGVTAVGTGVWGVSPDTGVSGQGSTGVYGYGAYGVYGDGDISGIGVYGHSKTGTALYVNGKAHFSKSGKITVAKGKTAITKTVAGVTSASIVIAVLQTKVAGTWITSAIAASGKFTVNFNKALPAKASVGWIVLD